MSLTLTRLRAAVAPVQGNYIAVYLRTNIMMFKTSKHHSVTRSQAFRAALVAVIMLSLLSQAYGTPASSSASQTVAVVEPGLPESLVNASYGWLRARFEPVYHYLVEHNASVEVRQVSVWPIHEVLVPLYRVGLKAPGAHALLTYGVMDGRILGPLMADVSLEYVPGSGIEPLIRHYLNSREELIELKWREISSMVDLARRVLGKPVDTRPSLPRTPDTLRVEMDKYELIIDGRPVTQMVMRTPRMGVVRLSLYVWAGTLSFGPESIVFVVDTNIPLLELATSVSFENRWNYSLEEAAARLAEALSREGVNVSIDGIRSMLAEGYLLVIDKETRSARVVPYYHADITVHATTCSPAHYSLILFAHNGTASVYGYWGPWYDTCVEETTTIPYNYPESRIDEYLNRGPNTTSLHGTATPTWNISTEPRPSEEDDPSFDKPTWRTRTHAPTTSTTPAPEPTSIQDTGPAEAAEEDELSGHSGSPSLGIILPAAILASAALYLALTLYRRGKP